MGCCSAVRIIPPKDTKQSISATSVTTVSSKPHIEESDDFLEWTNKLKGAYGFQEFQAVWFNTKKTLELYSVHRLHTENYDIECIVKDIDEQKCSKFKFAIIAPLWDQPPTELLKNLLFVYCKEERSLPSKIKQPIPVKVRIQGTKADKKNGNFRFSADLNSIVILDIILQLKNNFLDITL